MVSSNFCSNGLKVLATSLFLVCLLCLSSKAVGFSRESEEEMKVGSRPPGCENKCFSCRPCMATLVLPPPHNYEDSRTSHKEDHDHYYLLAWKCKCGNQLFQP